MTTYVLKSSVLMRTIYPVAISAEGMVSTDLKDIFNALNVPTIILVDSQMAVLLHTCYIVAKPY